MGYRAKNIERVNGSYVRPTCASCDWHGYVISIRTVEGWTIAERERDQHARTHPDWREIGRQAFRDGRPCTPTADPLVWSAISTLPVGGGAADIMRVWQDGWIEANLAAPVE